MCVCVREIRGVGIYTYIHTYTCTPVRHIYTQPPTRTHPRPRPRTSPGPPGRCPRPSPRPTARPPAPPPRAAAPSGGRWPRWRAVRPGGRTLSSARPRWRARRRRPRRAGRWRAGAAGAAGVGGGGGAGACCLLRWPPAWWVGCGVEGGRSLAACCCLLGGVCVDGLVQLLVHVHTSASHGTAPHVPTCCSSFVGPTSCMMIGRPHRSTKPTRSTDAPQLIRRSPGKPADYYAPVIWCVRACVDRVSAWLHSYTSFDKYGQAPCCCV